MILKFSSPITKSTHIKVFLSILGYIKCTAEQHKSAYGGKHIGIYKKSYKWNESYKNRISGRRWMDL